MSRNHRRILCALVLVSCTATGQQSPGLAGARGTVHVRQIKAKVHLDGKLDEPVWSAIPPITDFTQTTPDEGKPVSEKTEAFIFFDDENIYFGFRFYDSEPQKMVHRFGAHDARTGSDSVNILLDTFHDRRTAYFFSLNSRGSEFDAIINESSGQTGFQLYDSSWDGIWHSATSLEPWGWSAEVVIPFKSLRISPAAKQVWGLNLGRDIVRKNESVYWVPVTRYDQVMKPSKAGTMTGLEDLRVGHNIELVPFFHVNNRSGGEQPQLNGYSGSGGLDARYGMKANLTLSATANPDFGETEADEFTSEISRFEIFFPEKRKFFTEGANYFQTPMDLFFSRRIGAPLPDGEPQRIFEGLKLTGKTGPWSIGALQATTQRTEFIDPNTQTRQVAPAAFFGIFRLQHDILQKSALGFISVNRRQESGGVGQNESTHAVDLSILSGQHITWNSQFAVNQNSANPGLDGQHLGWQSVFNYNSDRWVYGLEGKFLGRRLNISHSGFEPETDRWSGEAFVTYQPFINRYGIRQIFAQLNYDESNGTRGELEDAGADADLRIQFKNFWTFHQGYSYNRTRFFDFTPGFQRLPTTRVYVEPRWVSAISSNENRPVFFTFTYQTNGQVQFNENFFGRQTLLQLTGTATMLDHVRWEFSGIRISESLRDGTHYQDRRFLVSRVIYQFTRKARARVLLQYSDDRHGSNFSLNSLFAYDFTSRSALYVGYNRQRRDPLSPADLGNQIFVKLSYLFAF